MLLNLTWSLPLSICLFNSMYFQKKPFRSVLGESSSKNMEQTDFNKVAEDMQQIYRRTPMPKYDFNKVAKSQIKLRHGCSPVNLLHIFKAPFYKNTSGGLLLYFLIVLGEML